MEYGHLLSLLPDSIKLMYRKYENLIKKVINAEWSKVFNRTCLKEYLWPTYTKIILIHIDNKLNYFKIE